LDHCGLLPKLVKEGFSGKIYATTPTAKIAKIILLDSAKLQEEDAAFKRKRHEKQGRKGPHPVVPLYTTEDAEAVFPLFSPIEYKNCTGIDSTIEACFFNAGHVLGSSIIRLTASANGFQRIILFSGDIGRPNRPIVSDPDSFQQADYLLIESTYGDRTHQPTEDIKDKLAALINEAYDKRGKILIPSFALERAQELLYYLNALILEKRIPPIKVFLDSPMASKITEVFKQHPEMFDSEMTKLLKNNKSPFEFEQLNFVQSTDESKALNELKGPYIIIAGSGMCTGGRIKHHLANNINNPSTTVIFVGYQAAGTLGRRILDGESQVRILGTKHEVKAKIARVQGFSAHADREEMLVWLKNLQNPPRKIFIVHGEKDSASTFAEFITQSTGFPAEVPEYEQEIILE
ncbi:MAG: MBL fold metallo-hydrolase, partial [Phycisphaerae bacterium]